MFWFFVDQKYTEETRDPIISEIYLLFLYVDFFFIYGDEQIFALCSLWKSLYLMCLKMLYGSYGYGTSK
jgi:hypothetical protein